jgi:hypothetical protein
MLNNYLTGFSKVKVIDSPCGTGKTSAIIKKINEEFPLSTKIFYVTPYLSEVNRVKIECPKRDFKEPKSIKATLDDGTEIWNKSNSLLSLVQKGNNICTTHALLSNVSEELIDALRSQSYVLILDEVFDVVKEFKSNWLVQNTKNTNEERMRNDIKKVMDMFLHHGVCSVSEEDYSISWDSERARETLVEQDRYEDVIRMAKRGLLYFIDGAVMYWVFPIELFRDIFIETYILTYMFDAQIQAAYYACHGLGWEKYHPVKIEKGSKIDYKIVKTTDDKFEKDWIRRARDRIQIVDRDINRVGDSYLSSNNVEYETKLSVSWYEREWEKENGGGIQILTDNTRNFFKNIARDKHANKRMWTVFKDYLDFFKGKEVSEKSFLSVGTRATNDWADKTILAYLVNKYQSPYTDKFFTKRGIKIDQDGLALSELVQWLWRSNIRVTTPYEMTKYIRKIKRKKKNKKEESVEELKIMVHPEKIQVYIPSERMRRLLINYLWFDKKG